MRMNHAECHHRTSWLCPTTVVVRTTTAEEKKNRLDEDRADQGDSAVDSAVLLH